uniref:Uncharacterized protein n=1 Tax=viral metagenome TaxID=1070528 RepID=A0A6C0CQL1_9ZZZZ
MLINAIFYYCKKRTEKKARKLHKYYSNKQYNMEDLSGCNKEIINLDTDELCKLLDSLDFDIKYQVNEQTEPPKKRRKTTSTDIILYKEEPFCCLCGLNYSKHAYAKHRFFEAKSEHKCISCDKWFYQHDHKNSPCFDPYIRM